jgi:hypothetical protein
MAPVSFSGNPISGTVATYLGKPGKSAGTDAKFAGNAASPTGEPADFPEKTAFAHGIHHRSGQISAWHAGTGHYRFAMMNQVDVRCRNSGPVGSGDGLAAL